MGIVLLPVFLVMLVGFIYQALKAGVPAILASPTRLAAASMLIAMSAVLAVMEIMLPFAMVSSSHVSAGGFVVIVTFSVATITALVGTSFMVKFRSTELPIHGLSAAAFFLAGGAFPIMWFLLADRLSAWFEVGWIY